MIKTSQIAAIAVLSIALTACTGGSSAPEADDVTETKMDEVDVIDGTISDDMVDVDTQKSGDIMEEEREKSGDSTNEGE